MRTMKERPILSLPTTSSSAEEAFQNEVLRPILKLQHDILLSIFKDYCQKHKINLENKDQKVKTQLISGTLKQNKVLRAFLTGSIVGQMSPAELLRYFDNPSEYNRRIMDMIIQRILSVYL
jgi:hypothetical protein